MPHPSSPIQDPYLGRRALHAFDVLIPAAMALSTALAEGTHGKPLTRLQRAGCQIIPNAFSIMLSIRELVRAGYLFSADILLRPLVERVGVLSYLIEKGEPALDLWEKGWPHKSRPSLARMLDSVKEFDAAPIEGDMRGFVRAMLAHFNSVVHADPAGLDTNIGVSMSGVPGYLSGANVNDPDRCDHVCQQTVIYVGLLMAAAVKVFDTTPLQKTIGSLPQSQSVQQSS